MFKNGKIVRGVVLASLLASTSLAALSPITAEANAAPTEVIDKVTDLPAVSIASGIEYTDVNGKVQKLEIPSNVAVQLNANSKRIIVKYNGQTKNLDNVKNVTIKNITVSNAVAFHYLTTAETVTFDNVKFQKGVDFGGLKNVKELIVKDTTFGEYCGYSLAVHDAPKLQSFIVAGAKMNSDLRIYCNKSLKRAYVYDSEIVGHAKQHTNQKGYTTDYHNTKFTRTGALKKVYTEGTSLNSAFNINLSTTGVKMGESKFNAATAGKIYYTNASGAEKEIPVPGNVYIKYIDDKYDGISVRLSNGQQFYIENPRDLQFRNVEFRTAMEFTHNGLRLENLEIVNSKIWNVQVWNSNTLKSLKVSGSEAGHACSLVKAYNNKVQTTFSTQDSKLVNVKAMNLPSIKGNDADTGFGMYNTYTHGYVYTANIGTRDYELPITNNRFDDYIASTNTINGEAARKTVGYAPVINDGAIGVQKSNYAESEIMKQLKATDKEDGDISDKIEIITNEYDENGQNGFGDFKLVVAVTDSDGNRVEKELVLTIF